MFYIVNIKKVCRLFGKSNYKHSEFLLRTSLAAVTTSRLLEYDVTGLEHLDLGMCASLQILSSSVKLNQGHHFQVPAEMFDQVPAKTLVVSLKDSDLSLSHSCVVSVMC